jgi:hypothetical protein
MDFIRRYDGGLVVRFYRGRQWTRINILDRVTSLTIDLYKSGEAYLTTETEGLWHSADISSNAPVFTRVEAYPFRQPERVFFNPYNKDEIWVSSFGTTRF